MCGGSVVCLSYGITNIRIVRRPYKRKAKCPHGNLKKGSSMKIKEVLLFVSFACVGPLMAGMSIEEWCQTLRGQEAAIRRGDWRQAAVYSAKASGGNDVTGFIPINTVNSCLV